jgi:hypothetical protein
VAGGRGRGQGQRAGVGVGAHRTEGSRRDSNFPSRSHRLIPCDSFTIPPPGLFIPTLFSRPLARHCPFSRDTRSHSLSFRVLAIPFTRGSLRDAPAPQERMARKNCSCFSLFPSVKGTLSREPRSSFEFLLPASSLACCCFLFYLRFSSWTKPSPSIQPISARCFFSAMHLWDFAVWGATASPRQKPILRHTSVYGKSVTFADRVGYRSSGRISQWNFVAAVVSHARISRVHE